VSAVGVVRAPTEGVATGSSWKTTTVHCVAFASEGFGSSGLAEE
jgi:hypothetical protein